MHFIAKWTTENNMNYNDFMGRTFFYFQEQECEMKATIDASYDFYPGIIILSYLKYETTSCVPI